MTDDEFSTEALRYLLDELEPARRAEFEARLARDPAAAAEFKRLADGVAGFAIDTAPAEPMTPAAQRAALAAILGAAAGGGLQPRRGIQPPTRWRRYGWPAAAALLLGLNIWQLARSVDRMAGESGVSSGTGTATVGRADAAGVAGRRSAEVRTGGREGIRAITPPAAERLSPAEEARRFEKLRSDHAALKRASDALRAEYDGMLLDLAQRTIAGQGVGRMAAMELVDAASYARGDRKGLIDLARGLLTTPGIVAVGTGTPPASTVPAQPGTATTVPGSATVTTGSTTTVTSGVLPGVAPDPNTTTRTPTPSAPTPQVGTATGADAPYAWSVFDETQGQGYLNLYNLPTVSADQTLQLWVKSADSGEYQAVGQVPATFYGSSGSLYYKLPDATATPAEILITREPKNAPPTAPTGPTILRGP